ncbi:hypothetical protein FOA52_007359 [Chlamydomonas sp. UWO 241]|nr:hypothetical protein FOA52_007359 [Chlamydomonas sp. UWO 241]
MSAPATWTSARSSYLDVLIRQDVPFQPADVLGGLGGFTKHHATGELVGMFGVFDGHGGRYAAEYVRTHLLHRILGHAKFETDMHGAIEDSYLAVDDEYMNKKGVQCEDGSTAVTAVWTKNRLVIANVGDSRAVLCRAGKPVVLSVDHKPNHREERQRIEGAGGVVVWSGTWRVGGVLAVSRAFGDKPLKKFVSCKPHVREEVITDADEFVILASDGLWDVVTCSDAVAMVRGMLAHGDATAAAAHLSDEAIARGSADNVAAIVVCFHR